MTQLTVLTRSLYVESIHKGSICIINSKNEVLKNLGDIETKFYFRSSAKPFQALPVIMSGADEAFGINAEEIAIMCASHSGEDFHRAASDSILKKIGLTEKELSCGFANPYNKDVRRQLIQQSERPSQLYNCCSGKHAGMLAVCKKLGFPVENYVHPEHPVQKLIINNIAILLGKRPEDIAIGCDNCSVPSYIVTMREAAYLYAQLAEGKSGGTEYSETLEIIGNAMIEYPHMISGTNEFCTDLIRECGGNVIGKVGAEGVYCMALKGRGIGIAIRAEDGNERALYPAVVEVLRQLGVVTIEEMKSLSKWAYPPVKNHKGQIVGHSMPVFNLDNKFDMNVNTGEKLQIEKLPYKEEFYVAVEKGNCGYVCSV
jgi:L-asparaginase II